ncbi:MAG: hypothetical protein WBE26_18420 [Phycisphaerae bacterium]
MSKFERRTVFDGNDAVDNREMKHITADGLREITDRLLTFTAETFDDGCPAHALVVNACGEFVCVMPDVCMQDKDCFAEAVAQVVDDGDGAVGHGGSRR